MRPIRNLLVALTAVVCLLSGFTHATAAETQKYQVPAQLKKYGLDPKAIKEMPIDGLVAYEAKNGKVMYISLNGRYVFTGQVTDLWAKQKLSNADEVSRSIDAIPLKTMGISFGEMGALTIGHGPHVVNVVTDPTCPACAKLNKLMIGLEDKYTFKVLALPALGGTSRDLSKRIACEKDRNQAANALLNETANMLPRPTNCDLAPYKQALLFADYIGVREVPFIIAPNSQVSRGLPKDLEEWLGDNSSFIPKTTGSSMHPTTRIPETNGRLLQALKDKSEE